MKEKNKQQLEKIAKLDNFRKIIVSYIDLTIRSMIAFIVIGVLGSMIFIGWLKWKPIVFIPVIFFISILSAPLFSRIRFGEGIVKKYEDWLSKFLR